MEKSRVDVDEGRKRKAEDDAGSSNSKNIRLDDVGSSQTETEVDVEEVAMKAYNAYKDYTDRNPVENEETKKTSKKLLADLKQKYLDFLKEVYKIYSNVPGFEPPMKKSFDFWSKPSEVETLEEFVDHRHPLWQFDRDAHDDDVLDRHIHRRWGGQDLNPRSSLNVFKMKSEENSSGTFVTNSDPDTTGLKLLERERNRRKRFMESFGFINDLPDINPSSTDYPEEELYDSETVVTMMKKNKQNDKRKVKETAKAIDGIREAINLSSRYTGGKETMSEEQVQTIIDIENAYAKILEVSKPVKMVEATHDFGNLEDF